MNDLDIAVASLHDVQLWRQGQHSSREWAHLMDRLAKIRPDLFRELVRGWTASHARVATKIGMQCLARNGVKLKQGDVLQGWQVCGMCKPAKVK